MASGSSTSCFTPHCFGRSELSRSNQTVKCVFCDKSSTFPEEKDDYLAHLFLEHRLVIADIPQIPLLEDYLEHWRQSFEGHQIDEYCTTMLLDKLPDGRPSSNERYYLLSDILPQDFEIRRKLETKYLEMVLARYQFERTDETFNRGCLYCRDEDVGRSRSAFLEHLYNKHFLQLGKPENLVFIDELIDTVEAKLESLVCLYCEKVFRDRPTLKEHMRKKGHKRINPENKFYDRFFIVNYKIERPAEKNTKKTSFSSLEPSKVFQTDDSDSQWSDWEDDEEIAIRCLFCPHSADTLDSIKAHMLSTHAFDFDAAVNGFSFYQKVKMVNYIRRQIDLCRCIACNDTFSSIDALQTHLSEADHRHCDPKLFNQPEYFFPTHEDDAFLCCLEDGDGGNGGGVIVVAEEEPQLEPNLDAEQLSIERFRM